MVSIRFAAGLLLTFLLAFQTLISAHADHQGRRMKVSWLRDDIGNIAPVEKAKVVTDGISASVVGNRGLGGRKLIEAHVIMQEKGLKKTLEETMQRKGSVSSTNSSKKTERDKNASEESLEGPHKLLNHQDNGKNLKTRTMESQSLGNLNTNRPQYKTVLSDEANLELSGSTSKSSEDEIRQMRLLEEADDEKVMQLLHKDYGGMKKPRRKPPVNNNEPND